MYDLAQARHEAVGVKATTSGATSHLNTSVNAKVDRRPLTVLEDIHRQSVQVRQSLRVRVRCSPCNVLTR